MRISASVGNGFDRPRHYVDQSVNPEDARRTSLPALVAEPRRSAAAPTVIIRPVATLLAQLVAGTENLPTSRVRRRADPQTSANAYRVTAEFAHPRQCRAIRIF